MSRVFAIPETGKARRKSPRPDFRAPSPSLQPALRIGAPGDRFEREADRVADAVMRMPLAPAAADAPRQVQRTCTECEEELRRQPVPEEEEELPIRTRAIAGKVPGVSPESAAGIRSLPSGRPLPPGERRFFGSRMDADFRNVRVHTGSNAEGLASDVGARAFTWGRNIVFGRGEYAPQTQRGRRLLAHELTHAVQQGAAPRAGGGGSADVTVGGGDRIQRAVSFDVTKWEGKKLGPPTPQNDSSDARMIQIPPTGQVQVDADVDASGDAGDTCFTHSVGTTQTAWIASCIADYEGERREHGSIRLRYNASMPMRDPTPGGAVWYDPTNVVNPTGCGTSVSVRHWDSPWHSLPKAKNNTSVPGSPLNYLTRYRRGLNCVTYLTTHDGTDFRTRPLKFLYWSTVHDFTFTPQYSRPPLNTAFFSIWPSTGSIRVNVGSKGSGETSDAPYYRTAGDDYNDHFNDNANWTETEST